jgi:hypothetical protein
MTRALQFAGLAVLVLLAAILAPIAWLTWKYAPEIFRAGKDTLVHADGLVGEARLAAKNSVSVSQRTTETLENLNETVTDFDRLVWKFDDTADAATSAVSLLGARGGATLEAATSAISHIDTAATEVSGATQTSLGAMSKALEPLPLFEQSLTKTSNAAADFLNNPFLNKAVENVSGLAGNAATITKHTDLYLFPPPYAGPHPLRHRLEVAGRDALRLIPAATGAVALAKGN